MHQQSRTSFRELRAHLKQRIESPEPTIIGNWHTVRAILIPIEGPWHTDTPTIRKARAQAKRRFAKALKLAWPT